MLEKKSGKVDFRALSEQEQITIYKEIIESSGKSSEKVNAKISMVKNFARGIVIFSIGYLVYDLYVSKNKTKAIISHSAAIGVGFVGGGLGAWAGLACGPYAFVCVPAFGALGVAGGGYLGDKVVRLSEIDGFEILFEPKGRMIFFKNTDVPGVVGSVGQILGNHGINIGDFRMARNAKGEALAVILIDGEAPKSVMEEISKIPACISLNAAVI